MAVKKKKKKSAAYSGVCHSLMLPHRRWHEDVGNKNALMLK